jgi:hypothetical protein
MSIDDRSHVNMTRAGLLIAAAIALYAFPAAARCDRPDKPSCTSWFEQFATRYDLDSCKQDVENYKDKVKEYADCVKDDAKQLEKDVKKAAEDFERRARKGVGGQ